GMPVEPRRERKVVKIATGLQIGASLVAGERGAKDRSVTTPGTTTDANHLLRTPLSTSGAENDRDPAISVPRSTSGDNGGGDNDGASGGLAASRHATPRNRWQWLLALCSE